MQPRNNKAIDDLSTLTHSEVARQSVALVRPSIEELFNRTVRRELHIVILDPRIKPWESDFNDAILYQESIGNTTSWEKPFDDFARNKAEQAWRDMQSNIVAQTKHPSSMVVRTVDRLNKRLAWCG